MKQSAIRRVCWRGCRRLPVAPRSPIIMETDRRRPARRRPAASPQGGRRRVAPLHAAQHRVGWRQRRRAHRAHCLPGHEPVTAQRTRPSRGEPVWVVPAPHRPQHVVAGRGRVSPAASTSAATTVWRYVLEAVDLLADAAPTVEQAMRRIRRLAYAILDGTLIPIDRLGGSQNRRYFSGKHQRHDVNAQVIADPRGRLMWVSPALPGSIHDLRAARAHRIIDALTRAAVATFAEKATAAREVRSVCRSTAATCPLGCVRSTPPKPRSAPAVNAPSSRSRPGRCWPSSTASHSGPPSCSPRILMLQLIGEQREPG
jgi:hypothetical protein